MKIRALLVAALLVGCAAPAPNPTDAPSPSAGPRESRVLTPAEQEAWLQTGREREAICAPLMPVLTKDGLECWEPRADWKPGGYSEIGD